MVDINLIGDEERREDRQREESFAKTISLDPRELQSEDRPFTFDKRTVREVNESSRKLVYGVLFGIIVLGIAVILYFMQNKTATTTQAQKSQASETTLPPEETTTPPAETTPAPAVEAPVSTMSSLERSLAQSTQLGAWTIDAVVKSFRGEGKFELISYFANQRFFVQFVSPTDEATGSVAQAVQQNLQPAEFKVLPPDRIAMNGRSMTKVLLKGAVSNDMIGAARGAMQRLDYEPFIGWMKQLARDRGLQQRSIDPRPSRQQEGLTRTPVIAKFYGPRDGVIGFLAGLAAANPSIDVAKIIVVSADRKTYSDEFLDLVIYFEFLELP